MDEDIEIGRLRNSFDQSVTVASRESFFYYDENSIDMITDAEILQVQYRIFMKNIIIIPW